MPLSINNFRSNTHSSRATACRAGNLQTALDITAKVLPAFESLFGIPFPLPKLDLIGIPDFAAGAMENWGLITYRETALLLDPQHASLRDIRSVANVIAHEMTHQVTSLEHAQRRHASCSAFMIARIAGAAEE